MNEPQRIPDDWLSAYLDGELSSAEQEQVDRALANDDRLRMLLTELRQVRGDVQRLPQHKLPPSFSDRVLQSCSKQHRGNSAVPHISVRARHRRIAATLLAVAATVMIAAWAIGPARRGGPAVQRQIATHDGDAAISADRTNPNGVTLGSDLAEAEGDFRLDFRSEMFQDAAPAESLPRDSADAASGGAAALDTEKAVPTEVARRPNISPSKSTATAEQPIESDAKVLMARVELTFPMEKIQQIKAQLQGPQTRQLGLTVTDLLRTRRETSSRLGTSQPASPPSGGELNKEAISSRVLAETKAEIQVADADKAVRPEAAVFAYGNVQPTELLLVEGTQEQIVAAVRQLNVVSANISDLTAKQLGFVSSGGAGDRGIDVQGRTQDGTERSAQGDRQATRYRRDLDRVEDAPPSQRTSNEPAVEDTRLAELADEVKDDVATGSSDIAVATPPDQTETPSLLRKGAAASAINKPTETLAEIRSRERMEVAGDTRRYQVLFVLLRESSK